MGINRHKPEEIVPKLRQVEVLAAATFRFIMENSVFPVIYASGRNRW